jgi:FAD-linked sulfhydryl oxidase
VVLIVNNSLSTSTLEMPTPRQWGPAIWFSLHSIAAAYPEKPTEQDRESIVKLFEGLSLRLPCGICSVHLQEELKSFPIYEHTESKVQLEKYVYDLHNRVNTKSGKSITHTFEEVQDAFVNGKLWQGFGGYPIPKDPSLVVQDENKEKKERELKCKRRNRNIACFVVLVVLLGIPIALAIPYLNKKSVNKK